MVQLITTVLALVSLTRASVKLSKLFSRIQIPPLANTRFQAFPSPNVRFPRKRLQLLKVYFLKSLIAKAEERHKPFFFRIFVFLPGRLQKGLLCYGQVLTYCPRSNGKPLGGKGIISCQVCFLEEAWWLLYLWKQMANPSEQH